MSSPTNQATAPTAVLNESQWSQINQAIAPLNKEQLTWMSGYLAGLAHSQEGSAVLPPQESAEPQVLEGAEQEADPEEIVDVAQEPSIEPQTQMPEDYFENAW